MVFLLESTPQLCKAGVAPFEAPLRKRAKIHSAHDLNVELVEVVAENEEEPERAPRIEVELKNGRRLILISVWEPKMLAELAQVLEGGENT